MLKQMKVVNDEMKEYANKAADWNTMMDKVLNYDPFLYPRRAKDYPTNLHWKKDLILEENQRYQVILSFYYQNKQCKMDNMSFGIVISNKNNILLKRGYYIGYKEISYGKLIGLAYVSQLLLQLGVVDIELSVDQKLINKLIKKRFDDFDPFQEKTAVIARQNFKQFDCIILNKKRNRNLHNQSQEEAKFVIENQMSSFIKQRQTKLMMDENEVDLQKDLERQQLEDQKLQKLKQKEKTIKI